MLGAALLLAGAVVLLPGPVYPLLVLSVAAAEQALVLALVASLVLVLCARAPRSRALPAAAAAAALVVAVVATTSAARVAGREGADVAWSRYLGGTAAGADRAADATEVYATVDGRQLLADVWLPPAGAAAAPAAGRPAVVRVHGGSWSAGERGGTPAWDEELAAGGSVVVDVDYRLAPAAGWREQRADVACALAWVGAQAGRLGVDPARVAVMGESAGAHLALLTAYAPPEAAPCGLPALAPAAVVALYPPTELVSLERAGGWRYPDVLEGEGVLDLMGAPPEDAPEEYAAASPLTHAGPGSPRTLLVHGDHDQVVPVDQSRRLAAALAAAGVEHRYVELPFANHGFDRVWGGVSTQTTRAVVADWLGAP